MRAIRNMVLYVGTRGWGVWLRAVRSGSVGAAQYAYKMPSYTGMNDR